MRSPGKRVATCALLVLVACQEAPATCERSCGCGPAESCLGIAPAATYRSVCASACATDDDCGRDQRCLSLSSEPAGFVCLTYGNPAPCPGLPYDPAWNGCPALRSRCDGARLLMPFIEQPARFCGYRAFRCAAGCAQAPQPHCM